MKWRDGTERIASWAWLIIVVALVVGAMQG